MDPILTFFGEYRFLSNFYLVPINWQGLLWQSVEHAYQAAKTNSSVQYKLVATSNMSAGEVKAWGKTVILRPDWEQVKNGIMYELVLQKFTQNKSLAYKLLETGDALLEEGNHWGDKYWGVCPAGSGIGRNELGKILMRVRSLLQETMEFNTPITICYSGIGSRETPPDVLDDMKDIARIAAKLKIVLRSGGAEGADTAFAVGCAKAGGNSEIYLPWANFNNVDSDLHPPTNQARDLAATVHPAWLRLGHPAKLLIARNMHQILGKDLNTPSSFVACWTSDGAQTADEVTSKTGGTGSAIKLASLRSIPVFNLRRPDSLSGVLEYMQELTQ